MNRIYTRLIALAVCLTVFCAAFSGCTYYGTASQDEEAAEVTSDTEEETVNVWTRVTVSEGDGIFTLNYEESETFNPITGTSEYNMVIAELMYEGLFELDENFEAHEVLCDSWYTQDGITWTFTLKNVLFHDGTELMPSDVCYSIKNAAGSSKYSERLDIISSVTFNNDINEVVIVLNYADYDLPKLLDVPIVKDGDMYSEIPAGTGPYVMVESSSERYLTVFKEYRDADLLPIECIYLQCYSNDEIVEAFESQELDLITQDPCGEMSFSFGGSYEIRYYTTTVMQYVGFNMNDSVLQDPGVRKAISYCIDKASIVSTVFSSHAEAALLAISSSTELYDEELAEEYSYSAEKAAELFSELGMFDDNDDGYYEYSLYGTMTSFSIDFIVNEDNEYKVKAAEAIAGYLQSAGINVSLRVLSWDAYMASLEEGDFDMYYAEVRLTPDFDLMEILSPSGSLNYGGITDTSYRTLIKTLKASATDEAIEAANSYEESEEITSDGTEAVSAGAEISDGNGESEENDDGSYSDEAEAASAKTREEAACDLYSYIAERAPIIPVIFKQESVLTHRGVITGMTPTQSNIFYGFTDWSVSLN